MYRKQVGLLALLILTLLLWIRAAQAAPIVSTDDFVITVKTDNPGGSSDTQFSIPTTGDGYNYNVDCNNDGVDEATGQTSSYICNYASSGTYTIRIKDNSGSGTGFPRIFFNGENNGDKLLTIEQWGTGQWTSMVRAFYGCSNLTEQATDAPNLSNVTDMTYMFRSAISLNQDISNWDTSNITDMGAMFEGASSFNQDISTWNTGNVTDMNSLFYYATAFNQDISAWNTANVTNMYYMFNNAATFNQDISTWNTANVLNMDGMFSSATAFNQDISAWNTAKVMDMSGMFISATAFNQDINAWNTTNVTNMASMFYKASAFNQDISAWNTANVTNMSGMFAEATVFNQDLSDWNTANVMNMQGMFYEATAFNQNIGNWNTAKVTDMSYMFYNATAFNQNIGNWEVGALETAEEMFREVALSSIYYDALLMGWGSQTLQDDVDFYGGNSTYCRGETARTKMINDNIWSITDGGKDCSNQNFVFLPVVVKGVGN